MQAVSLSPKKRKNVAQCAQQNFDNRKNFMKFFIVKSKHSQNTTGPWPMLLTDPHGRGPVEHQFGGRTFGHVRTLLTVTRKTFALTPTWGYQTGTHRKSICLTLWFVQKVSVHTYTQNNQTVKIGRNWSKRVWKGFRECTGALVWAGIHQIRAVCRAARYFAPFNLERFFSFCVVWCQMATNSDCLVLFGCDLWNRAFFRFFNFLELHSIFCSSGFKLLCVLVKLKSAKYRAARQMALNAHMQE